MNSARDLLGNLLDYIGEQAKNAKAEPCFLPDSPGLKFDHLSFAGLPGIASNLVSDGYAVWLRIERLEAYPAPALPALLMPVVSVSDNPAGQPPALDESAVLAHLAANPDVDPGEHRLALAAALDAYAEAWWTWAAHEKPRRAVIDIYSDLFALKHQIEAEETARPQELVWGIGVASWDLKTDEAAVLFEYPVLTQAMEISLEETTMAIEVRPRDVPARVDLGPLIAASVVGAAGVEVGVRTDLDKDGAPILSPFDPSSYLPHLKTIARALDANGVFREVLAPGERWPGAGEHLTVTDGWVLLARARQASYLLEDLIRLKANVEKAGELPAGPLSLVTPPSDSVVHIEPVRFRGLSTGTPSGVGKVEELYFPLPSNDEQMTIIEQLERAPGVTVQGPPGTGKTHTIANVICHYLATGRRVLVTSRGEPALAVLQEKLPEDVRHLTVALLVNDREGVRQFQAAIESIQHRVSQLNVREAQHEISTLETAIDRAHEEVAGIDVRLDAIARTQLDSIMVDGVPMRAQSVAELILAGAGQHQWFTDVLSLDEAHRPPLTEDEMRAVRAARRAVGSDLVYQGMALPSAETLPTAGAVADLHRSMLDYRRIERELDTPTGPSIKANTPDVVQAAEALLQTMATASEVMDALDASAAGWWKTTRERCHAPSFSSERGALQAVFSDLDELTSARADFLKRPVVVPKEVFGSPKALEAIKRAAEGGKPFGMLAFGANDAKQAVAAIRVSGLPPAEADGWLHVQRFIDTQTQVLSFVARWNEFAHALALPRIEEAVPDLRDVEQLGVAARSVHRLACHLDRIMANQAAAVFNDVPAGAFTGERDTFEGIRKTLSRVVTRARLAQATEALSALQHQLAGKTGGVSAALREFATHFVGRPGVEPDEVSAEYITLMAELRRVAGLMPSLTVISDGARRVRDAGAPEWAQRIASIPTLQSGEETVIPVLWEQAWTWARLRGHLGAIDARDELRQLTERRMTLSSALQRLYSDIVAKRAWLQAKNNATPKILSALNGYATAIRRIGQGTGTNAARYRRDARDAMTDAAGAVPCWIMSHSRISEAMPADVGAFDLVIVDEASQSDLWALPAILRGKKILVVGDDKQVSPDSGFIAAQQITSLRQRFLQGQPFAADMTPEKSLYDLAARVFAGNQVMLREHFRCVAPIIAYSNATFYKHSIKPLRVPRASERIDPPLVDLYVEGGFRTRKDCNPQEADAIADEIGAILDNPAMAGRTLGVVSLLGMEQAKYIDTVVRSRFPAGELMRRKFECGEARAFQGSERDIIFLSLVVDKARHHALSGSRYEQRFNVAASRARDRMYLVRSVELSDLSDADLRKSLLGHFSMPALASKDAGDDPVSLCESRFEREVYSVLTERGYRVIPQVKVGEFRIDMVVEGEDDRRLAIELDGDEFHGPDRWAHDMARQRILERAGWTFWRSFASTWSLHKEDVFNELIERLRFMRIVPIGAMGQLAKLVEYRTWSPAPRERDEADQLIEESTDNEMEGVPGDN